MPSGSRRRKAAKKKKEKEVASSSSIHGDDDQKVHEEKESDSGETNSPLSQDNNKHQHFVEGEDKRGEDTSSIQSVVTESEFVEGVNGNGESFDEMGKNDIQIDREIKLEDDSDLKAVTVERVEFENKSTTTSSSSSSDDESKFVDKDIEVINWEEPIEYAPNLSVEATAVIDLVKTSDLPEVSQVNEVVSHNLAVVIPNEESYEAVSGEGPSSVSVKPADLPEVTAVTKAVPVVDDPDLIVAESKVEVSALVSEIIPSVEPLILSKEEAHLDEDFSLKVNGKSEGSVVSGIDMGSPSEVDIIPTKATEDGEVISIAIAGEDESKTLPQSSVPAVNTVNGVEHKKDRETDSLERQTPIVLPPRPVQTTSSMGCCGLFELFTGSNR